MCVSPRQYFTSKAGLRSFASVLFNEVRGFGVKVCTIAPGLVNTELGRKPGPAGRTKGSSKGLIMPVEAMIQTDDIADAGETPLQFSLPHVCNCDLGPHTLTFTCLCALLGLCACPILSCSLSCLICSIFRRRVEPNVLSHFSHSRSDAAGVAFTQLGDARLCL